MSYKIILLASGLLIIYHVNASEVFVPNSKCVYFKNAKFGEYLYNSDRFPFDSNHHRVFTWRITSEGPASTWSKYQPLDKYRAAWIIEKKKNCLECFTIKSAWSAFHQGIAEPLYVSTLNNSSNNFASRRPIYTFVGNDLSLAANKNGDSWKIEMVNGFPDRVRIKYTDPEEKLDECLYAAFNALAFSKERRNVFTWSKQDNDRNRGCETWDEKGDWIVEDAICPPNLDD